MSYGFPTPDPGKSRVNWDHLMDYVPGVSTINSFVDIYQKSAYRGEESSDTPLRDLTYVHHIQKKSWIRLVGCAIPGINILCALFCDLYDKKSQFTPPPSPPLGGIDDRELISDSFKITTELENFDLNDLQMTFNGSILKLKNQTITMDIPLPPSFRNAIKSRHLTADIRNHPSQYITVTKRDQTITIQLKEQP